MQALHWNGTHLKLDLSYPPPKADKVMALIRVRLAGICSTDLQIFKGYMGFQGVPGHEFVGEVKEGPSELVGKRVVGEINFACGPFSPALAAIAQKRLMVGPLIDRIYPLAEGVKAVGHAARPGALKVLLEA